MIRGKSATMAIMDLTTGAHPAASVNSAETDLSRRRWEKNATTGASAVTTNFSSAVRISTVAVVFLSPVWE